MKFFLIALIVILAVTGFYSFNRDDKGINANLPVTNEMPDMNKENVVDDSLPIVKPISHATFLLEWSGQNILIDPVGGEEVFSSSSIPNLILITDIHGDHLNVKTLEGIVKKDTIIIAPQAVADKLPAPLLEKTTIIANDGMSKVGELYVTAIPMYNLPETADAYHTKGRGNGYLLEKKGFRVYVAGDTSDIPEMRALTDIDIAFIPMNLPYTMDVEKAASGVLDFAPKKVYPYHYRGQDGLSDIAEFKRIVNERNPGIEVVFGEWY